MRRFSSFALIAALLFVSFLSASYATPARAYGGTVILTPDISGVYPGSYSACHDGRGIRFDWSATGDTATNYAGTGIDYEVRLVAVAASQTIMNESGGSFDNTATHSIHGAAVRSSDSYPAIAPWTLPDHTIVALHVRLILRPAQTILAEQTYTYDCTTGLPASGESSSGGAVFTDDRANNSDAGQTVTAYCGRDGSVKVYNIDAKTSKGSLAFVVTPADIAKVPRKPDVNTLIKEVGDTSLWRLSSGELQINRPEPSGKMYAFRFADCAK